MIKKGSVILLIYSFKLMYNTMDLGDKVYSTSLMNLKYISHYSYSNSYFWELNIYKCFLIDVHFLLGRLLCYMTPTEKSLK